MATSLRPVERDDADTSASPTHDVLVEHLVGCRNVDGGWGYAKGKRSRLEPTCWALLALSASQGGSPDAEVLMRWPGSHGLLIDVTGAPANIGFNALAALTLLELAPEAETWRSIVSALDSVAVATMGPTAAVDQNNALRGWPWMSSTFSWVEPTALCLLACRKAIQAEPALAKASRLDEASRMLADRAIGTGGWNYGNRRVFQQVLTPQVPTTAFALLAMQGRPQEVVVEAALTWLSTHATSEQSLLALGLATMALATLGESSAEPSRQLTSLLAARPPKAHGLLGLGIALYALSAGANGYPAFRLEAVPA